MHELYVMLTIYLLCIGPSAVFLRFLIPEETSLLRRIVPIIPFINILFALLLICHVILYISDIRGHLITKDITNQKADFLNE